MSLKDIFLFRWLRALFVPARLKRIRELVEIMKPIARDFGRGDWDRDGVLETRRQEFAGLVRRLPTVLAHEVFPDYFGPTGTLLLGVIGMLSTGSVKRGLVIAKMLHSLIEHAKSLPDRGLVETAAQHVYEWLVKEVPKP